MDSRVDESSGRWILRVVQKLTAPTHESHSMETGCSMTRCDDFTQYGQVSDAIGHFFIRSFPVGHFLGIYSLVVLFRFLSCSIVDPTGLSKRPMAVGTFPKMPWWWLFRWWRWWWWDLPPRSRSWLWERLRRRRWTEFRPRFPGFKPPAPAPRSIKKSAASPSKKYGIRHIL